VALSTDERKTLATQADTAFGTVKDLFFAYARAASAPERFALGFYDASDPAGNEDAAAVAKRAITEYKIGEDQWGERNYLDTARNKVRVALRSGRNTGDMARGAPESFLEGEPKFPGAVLGEVGGKRVVAAGSGLRGPEDEALASLLLELIKRSASCRAAGRSTTAPSSPTTSAIRPRAG